MKASNTELVETIARMKMASHTFYVLAVGANNHAFIEFTGLMNEYIKVCEDALKSGVDFTQANVHTGEFMPMAPYQEAYIDEKLQCIFGRGLEKTNAGTNKRPVDHISSGSEREE